MCIILACNLVWRASIHCGNIWSWQGHPPSLKRRVMRVIGHRFYFVSCFMPIPNPDSDASLRDKEFFSLSILWVSVCLGVCMHVHAWKLWLTSGDPEWGKDIQKGSPGISCRSPIQVVFKVIPAYLMRSDMTGLVLARQRFFSRDKQWNYWWLVAITLYCPSFALFPSQSAFLSGDYASQRCLWVCWKL